MEVMIARLLHNARLLSRPNYNGSVYQRPDGSIVIFRNSHKNGITIDLSFPGYSKPPVKKLHVFQPRKKDVHWDMEYKMMDDIYPYPAIKKVKIPDYDFNWKIENQTLKELCQSSLENPEFAEAKDLSFF
jgi:hypothetical protein